MSPLLFLISDVGSDSAEEFQSNGFMDDSGWFDSDTRSDVYCVGWAGSLPCCLSEITDASAGSGGSGLLDPTNDIWEDCGDDISTDE